MSEKRLSRLPDECFENGVLRDGIAERIERLQQAAHPRLANLHGLHQENGHFFLAWEAINGQPIGEISKEVSEDEIYRLLRELIDAVEGLHQLGLVHGNLSVQNIIVAKDGVYLTEASALLWTDPERDVRAIVEIARELGLPEIGKGDVTTLRQLSSALDGAYMPSNRTETRMHLRAMAWAVALILLAIAAAVGVAMWVHHPTGGMLQS